MKTERGSLAFRKGGTFVEKRGSEEVYPAQAREWGEFLAGRVQNPVGRF